ncbi:bis-aminopropyl spermidine synthase family protein [Vallitalea okinawensis]|uniref:bis-aminopropyl spermidine synthase family protein n=1 Tax=Vallitalea okinawensis TaxID=2078660 RepID=UPI000CFCED65|nr:bis-aminopropyl spermidine synthase family protein [Vallitalea okinawensis]
MIAKKVKIQEGEDAIENFLRLLYLNNPQSNKRLARQLLLPIPLVSAIKKEFIKIGIVVQKKGIMLTTNGKTFVEDELGYKGIDLAFLHSIMEDNLSMEVIFKEDWILLENIYGLRPDANMALDQAHCTMKTSLKRAILALRMNSLIHKKILCIGDDDFVSIALGFLLKRLYPDTSHNRTEIHVADLDQRYLNQLSDIANKYHLPITCFQMDFKDSVKDDFLNNYDAFFTDPPYTLQGMSLFISRGLAMLKKKKGTLIFFSFAHKSFDETYKMQKIISDMGLTIQQLHKHFNEYYGGSIIGNTSQLIVLKTTEWTKPIIAPNDSFKEFLYTKEVNQKNSSSK